jgi:hypothetical protein
MQTLGELAEVASIVRATAAAISGAVGRYKKADPSTIPDAQTLQTAKVELGLAFQCLVRAGLALGLDSPDDRKR